MSYQGKKTCPVDCTPNWNWACFVHYLKVTNNIQKNKTQSKAKQSKAKQSKAKQSKAKQSKNKTKHPPPKKTNTVIQKQTVREI